MVQMKAPVPIPRTNAMLKMVTMKLMAPRIEDEPARCKDSMPRSTEGPGW